jgi:UDP-N-acetylglucosamine--N-acetylmuramyl-(pentapeptide) pyrophosphoryl-undecaprenol N-acetylglucosamine transferase
MKELNVIISGGGTGGHIYPAISIADEIKRRYPLADILFVGAKDRMEMTKVPEAGYPIEGLWITGIDRKFSLRNLAFPLKLVSSLVKANQILGYFKPHVVIGTGGFASGPLLKMANNKKIPTLIQEQNSYPGITNRMLGKEANVICTAYENLERYFPAEKIRVTGNPVRQDIMNIEEKGKKPGSSLNYRKAKKPCLSLAEAWVPGRSISS